MQYLCEKIVDEIDFKKNSNEVIRCSVMECGADMDCSFEDHYADLIEFFGDAIADVKKFPENSGCQRKVFISFKYKGRYCEICEHFGSQRDYICVRIHSLTYKQIVVLHCEPN